MRIAIITPVRNEKQHIGTTIRCMVRQTVRPVKWVIVNDGSTDGTGEIIEKEMAGHSFIEHVAVPDRGFRKPAQGVIESFYKGMDALEGVDFDVVSKFDGDLEFPEDMMEQIGRAFEDDPRLGITGGTRYEQINESSPLKELVVPDDYVCGIHKFYRRECFGDIGGLICRAGWDGVDNIKANMHGWKTYQLRSIKVIHLKPTGTSKGEGLKRAGLKYGDTSYYMGGYFWHFLLHAAKLMIFNRKPTLGYYMLKGFFRAMVRGDERESANFRKTLKRRQLRNVARWMRLSSRKTSEQGA